MYSEAESNLKDDLPVKTKTFKPNIFENYDSVSGKKIEEPVTQ